MSGEMDNKLSQIFHFHPKYDLKDEDVALSHLDSQPSPLASFVLPAFRIYRVLGICPSSFKFDRDSQKFEHVKGSWIRMAISLLLGALTALHCYGMSKIYEKQIQNITMLAMQKVLGFCYVFFIGAFFRAFLLNGHLLKEIFDAIQLGYKVALKSGCTFPPIWKMQVASSCLMLCCVTIALMYTAAITQIQVVSSNATGLCTYFENVADTELHMVDYLVGQDGGSASSAVNLTGPAKVALGVISCLVHLWGSFSWGGSICMNTLWGLMFWLLLNQFFEVVSNNSTRNTLKDIRNFNALTGIIDKYNEAYSWVILWSVSTGTVHFSMNTFQIFNKNGGLYNQILALVAFLWFGLMLIACAQVHKKACDIVQVIKSRFQAKDVWAKHHGNCVETVQGMMLVLHEIQTNSIGFKGLGFFTCSYTFIGTVLSAIATYAVIVLQFQN